MTTKDYLNQISRLNRMINNKLSEISQLRELACSVSAIRNEEKVQTSPKEDSIGTAISKIDEMEREVTILIDKYADKKKYIRKQIDNVPDEKCRIFLEERYIRFKSIREISEILGITDRGCKKLHKRALEKFENENLTIYCEKYWRSLLYVVKCHCE